MAQHFGDYLGVDTSGEQEGGADLPEVVEANLGQSCFPEPRFPVPVVKIGGVGGVAPRVGEHEPRSVQVPFDVARFLRYRRSASVAPAHLDQEHAPYARMRS